MGLDNGIYLRYKKPRENEHVDDTDMSYRNDTTVILNELLENEDYPHSSIPYFDAISDDICYWRKCWGLRDTVMRYLGDKYLRVDEYEYVLDLDDINYILETLLRLIQNPAEWQSPIWEWREYLNNNAYNYCNLIRLREDIKDGFIDLNEIEVIWYDSY
jgi:hypothetical protein